MTVKEGKKEGREGEREGRRKEKGKRGGKRRKEGRERKRKENEKGDCVIQPSCFIIEVLLKHNLRQDSLRAKS